MGIHISIDDFGTGYSSIERIEELPVSEIKLDLSLVHDFSPAGDATLRRICDYAHARDIDLVAEGVETPEHLERVRDLGWDRAQGYLLGRPAPEAAFRDVLNLDAGSHRA